MNNNRDIYETCEAFLADWDRQEWMQLHGEWASEAWDDAREEYDAALADLLTAVHVLPCGDRVDGAGVLDDVRDALALVEETAAALDGQIVAPEEDYIQEGTIDPDGVSETAHALDVGCVPVQGWDCTEGWSAYRHGDALYVRWWRDACGNRRDRDLWVLVESGFFAPETEENV